ncbi:LytR/AlgR family response regulator transcription factor [Chryseobacterium kwangjuense]|uniref:LytR/AlgR family response regulator transcription factor n=1 Tax=Chryseobacterium kwangjuense TaxID=267125 RepID=A0A135WDI5_9FLAO|nr:LytTR family DNA-binding domain-containing protein [Chryseobacterium kwangjuense]KXH82978.1 hypothetical protein AU378_11110 [Chryseobacterium kwangjuense]
MSDNTSLLDKHKQFQKVSIPTQEGFELISISEIMYLEASNSYTTFYLEGKKQLVATKNIGFYEEELQADPFLRIHQSYMVNINKIKRYVKADNGYVILTTGQPIRVSRSKKEELLEFFKLRRSPNKNP